MERFKTRFGWRCILSPEEVEYSEGELVLREYLRDWKLKPDRSAELIVFPWTPLRRETMEVFIEGLGQGFSETVNVYQSGGVEIVEREF